MVLPELVPKLEQTLVSQRNKLICTLEAYRKEDIATALTHHWELTQLT